ncbi:PREDICTED: periphilin-1 isoform X10 [Rhinopithecus bieti]|uniref:periphilin-1 isoform X10 n=2 Tax=Rhinopithecus bieti TaxID=61621 RepID=UPI00083BE373|nr:PREDICTED: periphilin-1 isoform X10 [Rhinopithecus bieti]
MAYRRDEMWSEGRYEYDRIPRERAPPRSHPSDESGYRWTRDDHSASRQPEYREMRDGFRRKSFYSSHYVRERSPHKRDNTFFRESPVGRKDSPHSRSGSSVSSRSYSPERSKSYSFHQSQHRNKERPVQSLKTSRDTSPSSGSAVSSSKVLDKPSRLTEKELAEAASKWAAEKLEKSDESNLPEISEYEVYRQDCETFGMVVKMLIEKDPSLEKSIQFALRQNLHEIESAGQTWQQVPPVRNAAMDHDGTPENEGEETAQSALFGFQHDASNHTIVGLGPNLVPEMKETTPQAPQPLQAPQPPQARKKRVRRMTQLRRTTGAPDITWGMLKKTTQEAERILLRTQTPFTPENLFLAMLSVVHCNSSKVLILFVLSLYLLPVPAIPY